MIRQVIGRLLFWICWPALYMYFRYGDRSRVLIRCNGEVILVKGWWNRLFADDRWALPGGGRRRAESTAQGACREIREELGMTVAPADLQSIGRKTVREMGIRYDAHFFLLELTTKPAILPHGETTAVCWSKLDEPAEYKKDIGIALYLERVNT